MSSLPVHRTRCLAGNGESFAHRTRNGLLSYRAVPDQLAPVYLLIYFLIHRLSRPLKQLCSVQLTYNCLYLSLPDNKPFLPELLPPSAPGSYILLIVLTIYRCYWSPRSYA
ncbi:hypothetical protein VFPPC_18217 [Pochonia chlamydosporia 170]|uniref:Uncharacterized protein n=1 Tax=Pochonia chlamydosporia 170 TaxID=1380566 RepID=A0A219AR06_METCM|nr:hypothetical protein VFPPC_18217 [Pochonia chlamydosporia 170]OWT42605.1 hypothetical protein VFPPC_18217 [Pochonia chlamydosporia 170]